ncbi:AAA family ATPase [Deinococcus soli (ex Cha et al. 2016)]|uniref:AAA family ATPase n=1 Tax=Deinococcus soli (ex Cha et al. 2016) TaxID=1309411 RepID=UPI0009D6E500|nr:AAA family ATPase [Deinococcus soli (ex Cha et al. 2016)]
MSYSISSLDNKNFEWFSKNPNCKSLKSIEVSYGKIRQIQSIEIDFKYPITAIAGKNGSGKSTLLAIIACAYHNKQNGYNPYKGKNTYYTFKDFFIETQTDTPMDDHILIRYGIYYNKWRQNKSDQNQERIGFQSRKRSYKKWNDYSTRISRNVVFISTDRIAPKYMTSIGRNHKKLLETNTGNSEAIINSVSNIMGRSFQDLKRREYSKHRITQIRHNNTTYSSFNMGAGEDSLFEIMHVLHNCPNETLILIDEIELGLHEEAQSRLLNELKNICQKKCLQIIFTTHSSCVMNALPPEGRLFIESNDQAVKIISEISTKFATGKLSGKADHELSIYTEDDICETALIRGLDNELVRRSKILPIGSALAVVRHASEMLKEDANRKFICLIDGDKKQNAKGL